MIDDCTDRLGRPDAVADDDWAIALAFSGGGTRAAALAFGVLEQLSRLRVRDPGRAGRMLDRVRVISAVSGGTFPAALYALRGDAMFGDFERLFLKRDVQRALLGQLARPDRWVPLAAKRIGRSDLAGDFYHREIFGGATFGELARRPSAPHLVINATDMVTGLPFPFTQQTFDLIGMDLATFPIARAVAASSAFPLLLSPVTLRNRATRRPAGRSEFVSRLLELLDAPHVPRRFAAAVRSYLDAERRPFIHLVDGGISDNLGLRGLLDVSLVMHGFEAALHDSRLDGVRKVAVIVVNAAAERSGQWNVRPHPGPPDVLRALLEVTVQSNSIRALTDFRRELELWRQSGTGRSFHLVEIGFDQLLDAPERNFCQSLPTSFTLPAETVDRLRELGGRLLAGSAAFRAFRSELETSAEPCSPAAVPVPAS